MFVTTCLFCLFCLFCRLEPGETHARQLRAGGEKSPEVLTGRISLRLHSTNASTGLWPLSVRVASVHEPFIASALGCLGVPESIYDSFGSRRRTVTISQFAQSCKPTGIGDVHFD